MIKVDLVLALLTLGLWVFCLVDVIGTPDAAVRNLPRLAWVLLVLLFPLVGSVAWLVAGRPATAGPGQSSGRRGSGQPAFPEYDRPGRAAPADPAKDEEFLRQVRARAEEQRRRHEQARRERERRAEEERERFRRPNPAPDEPAED